MTFLKRAKSDKHVMHKQNAFEVIYNFIEL